MLMTEFFNIFLVEVLFFSLILFERETVSLIVSGVSINGITFGNSNGSIMGGTNIFINGSGFSNISKENSVYIGSYPCIIQSNQTSTSQLLCRTTKATNFSLRFLLPVTVTSKNVQVKCSQLQCLFNYLTSKTPFIQEIFPKSLKAGQIFLTFGTFYIATRDQIKNVTIDDKTCDTSLFNFSINPNYTTKIPFRSNPTLVAGEYNLNMISNPGYPLFSLRTDRTSFFTQKNYSLRILPQISSLSSHRSGSFGIIIKVNGSGFSNNISDFTCQVAGYKCKILSTSYNELTLLVPPMQQNDTSFGRIIKSPNDSSIQNGAFLGSNGLQYKRYRCLNITERTHQQWLSYLRSNNVSLTLIQQKMLTETSAVATNQIDYLQYFKGYFFAPSDGLYQFMVIADDRFYMEMSNVANNSNIQNLQPLMRVDAFVNNYYNGYIRSRPSQTLNKTLILKKGYYYFEGYSTNGKGEGYFKITCDFPKIHNFTANVGWEISRIRIKSSNSSSIMNGTFELLVDGKNLKFNSSINLPYNLPASSLSALLNSFYNTTQINVWSLFQKAFVKCPDICSQILYVIEYIGVYSPAFQITFNISKLVLEPGSTFNAYVEILRQYGKSQRYSSIPYEFLYVPSNLSTLRLTVNSIPAICNNCTFQYLPQLTPSVTNIIQFGSSYQISIDDVGSIDFTTEDIEISMMGVPCIVQVGGNISNFTCTIPKNQDLSPQLPAGMNTPRIHVSQIGLLDASKFTSTLPLTVSKISISQFSIFGGVEAEILGNGFPINSPDNLTIFICGNLVTNITYVSNQRLRIIIPPENSKCNGSNNVVNFNGQYATFSFYYNPCLFPVDFFRCQNQFYPITNDSGKQNFVRFWSNETQWPNQSLPIDGENVVIPYEWNLVLDIDTPILYYLEINGVLIFDSTKNMTLQAHYIWVSNNGTLKIGSQLLPYSPYANIFLHGSKQDFRMVIDEGASGSKILAVTGRLQLYGQEPLASWSRLSKTAMIGDTQIFAISTAGWQKGDRILISPSYSNTNQYQEVTITEISGNLVKFVPPLIYQHYGSYQVTVSNQYGVIDARSAVGLLTRNIKIQSATKNDSWGCSVLFYGENANVKMSGVEIQGCGQFNVSGAALKISNKKSQTIVEIKSSVIHHCKQNCFYVDSSENISITKNIFFRSKGNMAIVNKTVSYLNFSYNLLVGTTKQNATGSVENVFAFCQISSNKQSILSFNVVAYNLIQGSEGIGYLLSATDCSQISNYYYSNNTAGSCEVAFLYESFLSNTACLSIKGTVAYASKIGLMANLANSNRVEYSNMMFADNLRSVTLRMSYESDDNTLIFKDSFISGISRPSCSSCYGPSKINYCNNAEAIRMLSLTETQNVSIQTTPLLRFDEIDSEQSFDSKAFLNNIRLENFYHSNSQLPFCSNMSVFRRNSNASNVVVSHYLTNTICVNCQRDAWVYFQSSSTECVGVNCTGPSNYLIDDQDGCFTGKVSQIIPRDAIIGLNQSNCSLISSINGYLCNESSFAILEYEITAEAQETEDDLFQSYLSYEGELWNSTTNSWQNFEQIKSGKHRFWSIIKFNKTIFLSTSFVNKLSRCKFKIQQNKLLSDSNNWIILKLKFSYEFFPEITNISNHSIDPLLIRGNERLDETKICGDNFLNIQTNQLFVLLNHKQCLIMLQFLQSLYFQVILNVPIEKYSKESNNFMLEEAVGKYLNIENRQLKTLKISSYQSLYVKIIFSIKFWSSLQKQGNSTQNSNTPQKIKQKLQKGLEQNKIKFGIQLLGFTILTSYDETTSTQNILKIEIPNEKLFLAINTIFWGITSIILILSELFYILKQKKFNNKIVSQQN